MRGREAIMLFPQWTHSSARLERLPHMQEVPGSSPGASTIFSMPPRNRHPKIEARTLVLGCHHVITCGPLKRGLDVSPSWLREVVKLPYQFSTLGESLKSPSADAMVFTFDDGDPTVGTDALPLLAEFGIRASAFGMAPGSQPPPAFWHDLIAAGWEIGSHSLTHPTLDLLDAHDSRAEIRESKLRLEDTMRIPIPGFAFPYGRFGRREIDFVCEAGYEYAVTTLPWIPVAWRSYGVKLVPRKMCEERTSMRKIRLYAASRSARYQLWLRDEAIYRIRAALGTASSPLRVLPRP
jgi:hypothetical protein